ERGKREGRGRCNEGAAGEVRPPDVPWQPAGHERSGPLEIDEMGDAKGDHGQAVKHPRDAQTLVARRETQPRSVSVTGEPGIQNPRGRSHHEGVTDGPPRI